MRSLLTLGLVLLSAHLGFGAARSPVVSEERTVQFVTDSKKTITVYEGMVWYDANPATRGLRFPPGSYTLEAEDKDYWYFRSATPLEVRILQGNQVLEDRKIPGGLMLGKRMIMLIPAASYSDGEPTTKIMIWKLGKNFLRLEGKEWKKNY